MSTTSALVTNLKKRSHEAAMNAEDEPTEQEVAAMSRSERKRHREKKRRSDVNKGFDELMALLLEIDPEVRADAEERASKGQCKRSLGAHEENVLSRVDLIATAVKVLKRVHTDNEKHKKMVEDLLKKDSGAMPRHPVGSGLSDLGAFAALDRSALLQQSALGGPGSSQWDPVARLRALNAAGGAASLRDYSTADLLALRGATAGLPGAASSDAALLQLQNKQAIQRQLLVQNMLMQNEAPSQAGGFSITEGLYGALGGGRAPSAALQAQKEEELRKLRAAGHQL